MILDLLSCHVLFSRKALKGCLNAKENGFFDELVLTHIVGKARCSSHEFFVVLVPVSRQLKKGPSLRVNLPTYVRRDLKFNFKLNISN